MVELRPRRLAFLLPLAIALQGLIPGRPWWVSGPVLAFSVLFVAGLARTRTVLDPEGLTICDGLLTKRIAWGDVERLQRRMGGVCAHLRDGRAVGLPVVEARAPAPAAYRRERSAQRVVAYAREHGHEIPLAL